MKPTRPSDVAALLRERGLRPSRVLGQNFLVDANILRILLETAELKPDDIVFEIGPGLGVLTGPLMESVRKVVAVEKDAALHQVLRERHGDDPRLELIHADVMDVNLPEILGRGVNKVVANLPYAVGTRILVDLFEQENGPGLYVVTVQKEVADRLAAKTHTSDFGLLSLLAQLDHDVTIRTVVAPTCFFPPPQVKSAIVLIRRLPRPRVDLPDRALFKRLIKHAFSRRRKQISTILDQFEPPGAAALEGTGLDPRARPEEIALQDWGRIAAAFAAAR